MANELQLQTTYKFVKNGLIEQGGRTTAVTVTGDDFAKNIQSIAHTAHSALALNDVGTEGYAWFKNIDATNFVFIGTDVAATFYDVIKLKPGEEAILRIATRPLYAKADTATVRLAYFMLED